VFGGMLAASLFAIVIIPLLFITAERLRQKAARIEKPRTLSNGSSA
jgi:hypothetical protein